MASMLDWLIPTGMEGDIASPMMDVKEFYNMLRAQWPGAEEWDTSSDWNQWISEGGDPTFWNTMGIDPYYVGYEGGTSGGWTDFEDLEDYKKTKLEDYHRQYTENVNPLTPESVLPALGGGLGQAYRTDDWGGEAPITPGAVKPIELQDLQKLHTGFYSKDYLAPKRQTLEDLFKGKKEQISGFGQGISGYGKRRGLMESAGESFRGGMENLYANIDKYKGSAMQRIYDTLDEWKQMTSGFGGGG